MAAVRLATTTIVERLPGIGRASTSPAITLDRYSHALPTLQAEAMGRLDAVPGRSPLDTPDEGTTETAPTELWLHQEPAAWSHTDGHEAWDEGRAAIAEWLDVPPDAFDVEAD